MLLSHVRISRSCLRKESSQYPDNLLLFFSSLFGSMQPISLHTLANVGEGREVTIPEHFVSNIVLLAPFPFLGPLKRVVGMERGGGNSGLDVVLIRGKTRYPWEMILEECTEKSGDAWRKIVLLWNIKESHSASFYRWPCCAQDLSAPLSHKEKERKKTHPYSDVSAYVGGGVCAWR